jgi:isopenicillin-N epimerase
MHRFGTAVRAEWPLDFTITYLNHGTVGVTPRRVLAAQQQIRDAIERQPSQFLLRELTSISVGWPGAEAPRIRQAAAAVAERLGADPDDMVFIDNATTGANAVLRSFPFAAGDEILVTDLGYGGVTKAAAFAARQRGAVVRTAVMPYPIHSASQVVEAFVAAIAPRTRLAIVDHITSQTALIMPLAEIAAECRSRGVALLVDGAHAPGAIPLDIPSLGVDWYIANLHKWMWVPRSSGILWTSSGRKADLHPAVISWGLDQGFTVEFDAPGTRDPSAHLAAPEAIRVMEEFGAGAVRDYNHSLAWEGGKLLAEYWGSEFVTPESMIGTMATVPLPPSMEGTADNATRLRNLLLFDDRIEVQLHAYRDRLHARISAQIYNDLSDVERLAAAVVRQV